MDKKKLEELRDYYDNTDTSAEISDAELDTEVVNAPMVGITVRLPAEVLQRVRDLASIENVKTTALIRRWIEEQIKSHDHELAPAAHAAPGGFVHAPPLVHAHEFAVMVSGWPAEGYDADLVLGGIMARERHRV